jgi:hypothetical protein
MRTLGWLVLAAVLAVPWIGSSPADAGPATLAIGPGLSIPGLGGIAGPPVPASPPNDPHPVIPWSSSSRVVRYLWVAPRPIVVDTPIAWPVQPAISLEANAAEAGTADTPREDGALAEAAPQFGTLRRTFVVPGYYVAETHLGYYYPARWTLEQAGAGLYQWRLLPAAYQGR